MASPVRQIFAFSGVLESGPGEKESFALVEHAISLAARPHAGPAREHAGPARVCYVPTAVGDAQAAIDFYQGKFAARAGVQLSVLKLFTQPSVPYIPRPHLLGQDVIWV